MSESDHNKMLSLGLHTREEILARASADRVLQLAERGQLVIRWIGESNGYYSESVDFCHVEK